jgi:hypothetical protein
MVSMITWSETKLLSMMRGGSGAMATPWLLALSLLVCALLALDDFNVVLGWLNLQHFALVVANHFRFLAAPAADALLRHAGNNLLYARQMGRQGLAAGMRAPLPLHLAVRFRQGLALALRLDFFTADAGFYFQQLQLQIAQLLAARSVLGDAPQTQMLLQHLNLQPRILQFFPGRIQLLFQLCVDLGEKSF